MHNFSISFVFASMFQFHENFASSILWTKLFCEVLQYLLGFYILNMLKTTLTRVGVLQKNSENFEIAWSKCDFVFFKICFLNISYKNVLVNVGGSKFASF